MRWIVFIYSEISFVVGSIIHIMLYLFIRTLGFDVSNHDDYAQDSDFIEQQIMSISVLSGIFKNSIWLASTAFLFTGRLEMWNIANACF